MANDVMPDAYGESGPPVGTAIESQRDALVRGAHIRAYEEHKKRDCEEFDLRGLSSEDAERLYCASCKAVLLTWGEE